MASTHRAARRGLTGRRALLTLVVAGGVVLAPLPAAAAPEQPATSQQAAALVAERAQQLEVVTEQFNEAREALKTAEAAAATAQQQVAAAEASVTTARGQVVEVARSAYTGESLSTLQAMLSSDSADELLDRVGTLGTIADHNNELLAGAQTATEQADAAKAAAAQATADAQALVDKVAAQQDDLNAQIAEYQAQYDRLTAAEKEASRAQAERSSPVPASAPDGAAGGAAGGPVVAAAPAPAASGVAQTVVDTALAQVGDPYVWAAAGPDAFDCSGLTMYAFAAAGISLPHSSKTQATMGTAVSRDQLQPGDLVAFYTPVSHIGIYIGNGQMVHASTSGEPVKISSIDAMGTPITAMRRLV